MRMGLGVFAVSLLCVSHALAAADGKIHKQDFYAFGTLVSMSLYGVDEALAQKAFATAIDDFNFMHEAWHPWQAGSLGRVNSLLPQNGQFSLAPSIKPLIQQSTQYFIASDGMFNPAIGGLIKLWGFSQVEMPTQPPDRNAIQALVAKAPKMTDLEVQGFSLKTKNTAVLLDFGGFAKGYGIDRVIEHLRELGVQNAVLNAGGDIRAIGSKGGKPWNIGIRHPRHAGVIASIEVMGDETVLTSGDYERYFIHNGERYHHIIDPRTGYPAKGVTSVTVVSPEAALADAAATALMVAGLDDWRRIATKMGVKQVMLIASNGDVHITPELKKRMRFEVQPLPKIIESPGL